MALDLLNSSNLEQLALNGLIMFKRVESAFPLLATVSKNFIQPIDCNYNYNYNYNYNSHLMYANIHDKIV